MKPNQKSGLDKKIKQTLRRALEHTAPSILASFDSLRGSINRQRYFRERFQPVQARGKALLYVGKKIEILSGPFKGMCYLDETVFGSITPKWIGCYEIELHGIIDEIINGNYTSIINIGCAEGYYAVGFLYRMPSANIYAYDIDYLSRSKVKKLAKLNGVARKIKIAGQCSWGELAKHSRGKTVIVCDIDGGERALLDPVECPSLLAFDILVEVHEEGKWTPSTLALLKARFEATHLIKEITATDRESLTKSMAGLDVNAGPDQIGELVDEHRSDGFKWLWMRAIKSIIKDEKSSESKK